MKKTKGSPPKGSPSKGVKPGKSKLQNEIKSAAAKFKGTVLAIDPSSGSAESVPGFALFEKQILTESGTLEISRTKKAHHRLRELALCLSQQFTPVDVLVIEYIPPFMSAAGGGGFRTQAVVNLHRAIGVIMASLQWEVMVQVAPQGWHGWLRARNLEEQYVKKDEHDAMVIGLTAFTTAGVQVLNEQEVIEIVTSKDELVP